jgi:uncharacterized membrane protein
VNENSILAASEPVPWLCTLRERAVSAVAAAAIGVLATVGLPIDFRVVVPFDLAAATYLTLFFWLMSVATPQQSADLSRRMEPSGPKVLIATVVLSVVAIATIAFVANNLNDKGPILRNAHLFASLMALFLSWMLVHIFFGIEYMRMYYDKWDASTKSVRDPDLDFPTQPMPDYWDFMYYSYTIAMCYQTSDVTINVAATRRLTLLHAIYSFFFMGNRRSSCEHSLQCGIGATT